MAEVRRDVVVTGLGVVSPIGSDVESFWHALCTGEAPVGPITTFDTAGYRCGIAQTIPGARGPGDPASAFALDAASQALAQAGLDATALRGCGLAVATTAAGWTQGQRLFQAHLAGDAPAFDTLLRRPQDLHKEGLLAALACRFGLQGPCALLSSACAAASSAIAWAAQRIRDGDAALMLAGASDALTEVVFAGFHAMRLLADDACRPFSVGRHGLVLSEGAAFLVLEDAAHARSRGAVPLARLSGWGLSCDAAHPTTPRSDGILRAMTLALADARRQPRDVDQVSAHGTGSAANDAAEAQAIACLLDERLPHVPVTAIKGALGHTEGAAGAFGALAAVVSLQRDTLPPLAGFTRPDPVLPALRLATGGAESYRGRNVLVNASGFGGANAALLFEKPDLPALPRSQPLPSRTGRPMITATIALTEREESLIEPEQALVWPGGGSLPLDHISGLVLTAAQRLLGTNRPDPDAMDAVVLGTTYGSQARHERIWAALATDGPRGVDANDFALSTFNAPGSATASACSLGGANLVFLGAASGAASIEESARLVTSGRARRVLAGAHDEATPYFRRIMAGHGETDLADAVALLLVEDEARARQRGAPVLGVILGSASRAPSGHWPTASDFAATMREALQSAGIEPPGLAAVVLDPNRSARDAQLAAIESLCAPETAVIDPTPVYGNCLAASTPLALHLVIESARRGCWPEATVLRGPASLQAGRPVLINACGLMAGCASLLVIPHGD